MAGASKVKAKKAKKAKKAPARKGASQRPSADGALRKELAAARNAAKEAERRLKEFGSVAQALGAPRGNAASLKSHAARVRKEAAGAAQLRKQLASLQKQSKAASVKWQADLGKLKKAALTGAADAQKSHAKIKTLQSAIAERDQKLKAVAGSAKQALVLQNSVAKLTAQQAAAAEKQKQLDLKAGEKLKQLDEASKLVKAQLAEKTKLAKDGARAVVQNQKLTAAIIAAKEAQKKFAEQCKAAEQRAKEAEKRVVALEKQVAQLTPKPPVIRPGGLMQLKQVDTKTMPEPKPLIDQAKARIKQAEERIKAAPKPASPPRPRPTVVEDEIPFDEDEEFEEEEEEEEASEPASDEPSAPPETPDDDEEPPREDDT
ncbi:MAG: hypothetical protein U1E76_08865 [Planctomycetota bacterium]